VCGVRKVTAGGWKGGGRRRRKNGGVGKGGKERRKSRNVRRYRTLAGARGWGAGRGRQGEERGGGSASRGVVESTREIQMKSRKKRGVERARTQRGGGENG